MMTMPVKGDRGVLLVIAVSYCIASIAYFAWLDSFFYVRHILNYGLVIGCPLIYLLLTALYVVRFAARLKISVRCLAAPGLAMAVGCLLFCLLAEMWIGVARTNPFGGGREIFGIYVNAYCGIGTAVACCLSGFFLRAVYDGRWHVRMGGSQDRIVNVIFHMPVAAALGTALTLLATHGFITAAFILACVTLAVFFAPPVHRGVGSVSALLVSLARNETFHITLMALAAFLVRCLWGLRVLALTGADFPRASDDGLSYDPFGATLASGGVISAVEAFYRSGFGYWYFLAAIYRFFGAHNFTAVIVAQALIGCLVPVFTYMIAKRLFVSRRVAVIAGWMTAFDQTLIFLSAVLCMEAIYIPLVLLALLAVADGFRERIGPRSAFLVGCAFGLAYIVRTEVLLFPIVIALLLCFFLRGERHVAKIVRVIAALFAGFALLVAVQQVTNYAIYGKYRLTVTALEQSFMGDYGTHENQTLNAMGFNPFRSVPESLRVFIEKPLVVTRLMGAGFIKRTAIFFFKPNFGTFDPIYGVNPGSDHFFRYPVAIQLAEFFLILGGVVCAFRRRKNLAALLILAVFPVYLGSMYGLIWATNSRHRGVLVPIFFIFFAWGVRCFYEAVRSRYAAAPSTGGPHDRQP